MKIDKQIFKVAKGVWGIRDLFVNVYFISVSPAGNWVLIDTGLRASGKKIIRAARMLFGGRRPDAILLTHGHFDHVGGLEALVRHWQVPVYAHSLEAPYLTGLSSYPAPNPLAGGGIITLLSFLYPSWPKNIGFTLNLIPKDNLVPCMNGWVFIHTPGHTPGHMSLFRTKDRLLIAGDAFVTTRQESLWNVMTQKKVISGPPKYYTSNWLAAENSINALEFLNPAIAATGHGRPMEGDALHIQLRHLASNFKEEALPWKRSVGRRYAIAK